ncbi:hypothetical protein [Salinivibrio sp. ML290]|uniref:hypothetical protein n=1 Tax=Salinivibrio sp. ML290 TaxID=1909468 RepID=UPI0009887A24|nr:hypothetical protein [Salinivibrio sp. ML290]OOE72103.1 hypothetical protein BZG23_15650 [Salinivibrio sp. ML290]
MNLISFSALASGGVGVAYIIISTKSMIESYLFEDVIVIPPTLIYGIGMIIVFFGIKLRYRYGAILLLVMPYYQMLLFYLVHGEDVKVNFSWPWIMTSLLWIVFFYYHLFIKGKWKYFTK